jgi:hypothetical protein
MSSRFVFLGWLAVAALASPARLRGQDAATAKSRQIVLRPAAAPVPALKYFLLPERRTLVPGNAAIFYHRAIELLLDIHRRQPDSKKSEDILHTDAKLLEEWLNGPLSSLPRERVQRLVDASRDSLHEVELGARRQTCDWEFGQREEAVYLMIGEIQQMRSLNRLVLLRARLAVAEGRIDDAVHWIQTGFAMARHSSEGPLLIQSLVGAAISLQICVALEDLIQAPGAPNLYWALAHRPRPLVDFSTSLESERLLLEHEIPSLRQLDGLPLSAQQGREFAAELETKLFKLAEITGVSVPSGLQGFKQRLGLAALVLQVYSEAKRALIAQGRPADLIEAMPSVQVATLYTLQQYAVLRDDLFKWTSLPYYQSRKGMDDAMSGLRARTDRSMLLNLFAMALPGIQASGFALARSERRFDAIQCIEAIRLNAALHGKLPARLEDIVEAPVPLDGAIGKPFEYRAEGDRAIISAPSPPGELNHPAYKINYELKLTR